MIRKVYIRKRDRGGGLSPTVIEYRSDDITTNFFFSLQRFGYHVSVEHDEPVA